MSKTEPKATFSVFGSKPKDAILVPEMPILIRNNCQAGKWTAGDKEYGSKSAISIVKFSQFFGDLGLTKNALWGQVWFVAEEGDLPRGIVMVTYIKSQSLGDFNLTLADVQQTGVEPASGVFIPEFTKRSGNKDGNPINYYSLSWGWKPREEKHNTLEAIADVVLNNQHKMVDLEGTKNMQCLDGLSSSERSAVIMNGTYQQESQPALSGHGLASLPSASVSDLF